MTNGYSRILRFESARQIRNAELERIEQEEMKQAIENSLEQQKSLKFRTFIKMVNMSICSQGRELMSIYLKGIQAALEKTEK